MKFSEKWLREWSNPNVNSSILYDQLSMSGIEVESIKKFKPIFNDVVIGEIVECDLHDQEYELKIVKVNIGKKKLLNIICRAPNCRKGIKVAVATIGATISKNIKIDYKVLKGKISEGMLCSFFELGLFYYSKNIIEFLYDAPIGMSVDNYLSLEDNIIQVSTTSNRPDGLSLLGLSRNIAAMNNFKIAPLEHRGISSLIQKNININIVAKKECISYMGRIIHDINLNIETPFWMKKKLFFSDMLSDNIITNIINYILIELGQPLNILNSDHINGNTIIVRMAHDKEKIILKDNIKINLNKNILVFSDSEKILYLPGNIYNNTLNIDKNTKNIFLSVSLINKKAISCIIKNINSNKILEYYNYGIDPSIQDYAIEYATDLIIKICGGIPGPITIQKNCSSVINTQTKIKLHHEKFNKIIGCYVDPYVISNILYNLDYQIDCQKNTWNIIPPSWRFDILIEEDVISDILRIYGFNNINLISLKESYQSNKKNELTHFLLNISSTILINHGYYEVINYSFIDPKIQNIMFPNKKKILVSNPISQDMSCMRSSLWPGLLKNISYNKNRQQNSIRLFESGLCFSIDKTEILGVKQEMFLAAAISGNYEKENWYSQSRKVNFYDLKGDLESILESICTFNDVEFRRDIISGLHPEQSASIYLNNNYIGSIGALDPRLENTLNVYSSTFLFEISLNSFPDIKPFKIQEISKFPTIRRDIAILISEDIEVIDIIKECKKFFTTNKVEINIFDVYFCKEFSMKKKSLGISFVFQNTEKTLEDHEINIIVNDCIKVLKNKFKVILRKELYSIDKI